jgi:hypothetical protein
VRYRAVVLLALVSCWNRPKTHGPPLDTALIAKIEAVAPDCDRPLGPKASEGIACTGIGTHVNLRTDDNRVVIFRMAVDAADPAVAFQRAKPLLSALAGSDTLAVTERHLGDLERAAHWSDGHVRVETGQLSPGGDKVLPIWQVELDW